jgi:hypothetical protein
VDRVEFFQEFLLDDGFGGLRSRCHTGH